MARPPIGASAKTERLQIRLSPEELAALDAKRGELSRSAYVCRLISTAPKARTPRKRS